MEQVVITDIKVSNPKGFFLEPIKLSINFSVSKPLQKGSFYFEAELEWKVIYVGSAESYEYDQMLEHFYMQLSSKGPRTFEIEVEPPDASKIPTVEDLIGSSLLMICVFYRSQEFFR